MSFCATKKCVIIVVIRGTHCLTQSDQSRSLDKNVEKIFSFTVIIIILLILMVILEVVIGESAYLGQWGRSFHVHFSSRSI